MKPEAIGTHDTCTTSSASLFYTTCMIIGIGIACRLVVSYIALLFLSLPAAEILLPLSDGKVLVLPPAIFSESLLFGFVLYGIGMLIGGGIPAMLVAAIGSFLTGSVYRYIQSELSLARAYILGLHIGTIFLTLVTVAVYLSFAWFSESVQRGNSF